jgi:hypothetical protein
VSAKKGLHPTQNLTTKVFEIQLDADITSSNSNEKKHASTIIESNEEETVLVSVSSLDSKEKKRRSKLERRDSNQTNK